MAALDWIGLDAYPGTVFPPVEGPGGFRDGMVNAMSSLRCFARTPGIPATVPMKVEENGWPTFPGRSRAMQADVLREMVTAVHDFRGTYNVTDYRWFNLRDGDSSSPQAFQHFGLLDSAYVEKPAFAVYRSLVAALHRDERAAATPRRRARLRLRLDLPARRSRGPRVRRARRAAGPTGTLPRVRAAGAPRRSTAAAPSGGGCTRRTPPRSHRHRVRVGVRLRGGRLVRRARLSGAAGGASGARRCRYRISP